MAKRYNQQNSADITHLVERLIGGASSRYRLTVQVANRAKHRRYEEMDDYDDNAVKPIRQAIIEMYDEMTQPEILSD